MKAVKRTFIPGDDWIYFKIYSGSIMADWIIINKLFPLIKKMLEYKFIEKFFFIRYYDPDFHIRIRFLLSNNNYFCNIIEIVNNALKPIIDKQYAWKIQLDTYQREIERYNPYLIEEIESLFYIDSVYIMQIIRQIDLIKDEKYRWMIALFLNDKLLSDFNFTIKQKKDLMTSISEALKVEFGFNQFNSKQFNIKYRANKFTIESILNNNTIDDYFKVLAKLVCNRSIKMKPIISNIQHVSIIKRLNIQNYVENYIHMTMNRLFIKDARMYELIIYDFMKRYYTSKIVINNQLE